MTDSFEVTVKFLGHRPMNEKSMVVRLATGCRIVVLALDDADAEHDGTIHPMPLPSVSHIVHNKWLPLCSIDDKSGTSMETVASSTVPSLLQSGVRISSLPNGASTVCF